ncbi:hypothetical protein DSECCO2_308370 [anaerobic digester metagenome]|jgi:hypothetical protein|uniref:Uncharacterized protein n=1 Tax=Methanobacterium subterraneum TaxID=59277 RepID=A0A2H4VS71_9EURY|nr:hypothetical protein [Methanobacterium subterraneum]AUB60880.1 hypothetical protein BK009_09475 [Methanobacterium subterraneum]
MKDKTSGHYHKLGVQNIIKRFSTYNAASKAGVFDNKGWYKYGDDKRRLINLLDDEDYQYLVNKFDKRLLGTLNYFRPSVFQEWQQKPWDVAESLGGLEDTMYYMLSIDLDLANDYTVNDVKALEALETAARFISDDLRKVINDKFLILFSGNGIYFHLHPEFVASGETNDAACESRATELQNILDAFNLYIQTLERKLFQECPEVHGLVKVDAINNRKRVFKLPLTTHKDLPYLVYPIGFRNIQIRLKTLPLSDDEIQEAAKSINIFFDKIPSLEEHKQLGTLLSTYNKPKEVNSKSKSKEVHDVPPVPIPIDIIKEEQICSKIFSHASWPKGNTRRVAFITTVLRRSGWDKRSTKRFVKKTAINWKVGALDHVIDSWLDFDPPNIETIYNIGSDYPEMTMGDLRDYFPLKPDYSHVMDEIFRLARNKGFQVPEIELKDENNECRDIKLKYGTEHLFGFNDLETATSLFGMEYKIAFKVLWYTLASFRIAISRIKAGRIELDGRISPLFVLPAGRGKNQIKTVIKKTIEGLHCDYGEPTSLHAEQLVGKTVKNSKTGEFYHNRGYLNDDYVVIDEAYQLLTSSDLKYAEARKYIRVALDPYPNNTVHKRTTEYGREGALEFNPHCPISLFVQPIRFENEILVLEGDIRRFTIAYPLIQSSNVSETLRRRIFDESDNKAALDSFITLMSSLEPIESFQFSEDAKKSLEHLSNDLYKQGVSYSHKIACLNESIIYTSQNTLVKFSAIQAFQHGRSTVERIDIILAYMDLFEIMEHTYKFIEAKIPGSLDYGEGWNGAVQNDQQLLKWLHANGANSKENAIPKQQYIDKIKELFGIEKRQAESVYKKHFEVDGWIGKTKKQKKVFVWLKFQPDECNNCTVQSDFEFEYESYIQCYEQLLIEEAQKELHTANITIKEEAG